MKNSKTFWAEIKQLNGKSKTVLASTIGGATGQAAIAELWKTHYSGLLNSSKDNTESDAVKDQLLDCDTSSNRITVSEVKCALKALKLEKACGLDTLSTEHFLYASNKVAVLLALCFNTMLQHSYTPHSFTDTILVPIVKDKKGNLTEPNNYRPIAITSVASKLFEKIVLFRYEDRLVTTDNQFSFKRNHSTDLCVFTLKSIVNYFNSSSSPVYICYLDASKAFDRINYWYLFDKLLKRNIPKVFVRLLAVWYCTQKCTVRWGSTFSLSFPVANGVRQGGILSPLLFNIYMDDLSKTLNQAKVGCMFNGTCFNHLMYADDMVLIAPSIRALQVLLSNCESYGESHDIIYNVRKSVCMCFIPKGANLNFDPCFLLAGRILDCIKTYKYLGVHITCDLKDNTAIRHQIRNIYSRGNSIIRNFSHCSDDVKCELFQSYCTNFYCAPLWCCYNTESMRSLKVAYNRVFRILMNLVHRTSMSANFVFRGMNPFKVILRRLTGSFKSRIFNSMNTLIQSIVSSRFFFGSHLIKEWKRNLFNCKPLDE